MAQTPSILFNPSPDIAAAVLAALIDPSLSFNMLAAAANTTPDALSLWLTRQDIRERIESTDRITTWRTRLIAASHLHTVPPALVKILTDFTNSQAIQPANPLSHPADFLADPDSEPSAFRKALLEARRAETTRKSAAILISLTRTRPTPGPDLAAQAPVTAAQSPQATSAPTPACTSSPDPQSEIPDPQSLQSLLAQLAPHLEHIAAEIGIDDALAAHDPPIPAPPRQDPPPPAGRNAGAPIREDRVIPAENPRSDPPSDPQEPESASATVPGRSEHWP